MDTQAIRSAIVAEAQTWLGTPYHHGGDVKGAGVDCVMLLVKVYQRFFLLPATFDPRPYPMDWHLHRSGERYLAGVLDHGCPVAKPQPGDIALYRYGRAYSHAGIVTDWPTIIHAHRPDGAVVASHGEAGDLAGRDVLFFSIIKD